MSRKILAHKQRFSRREWDAERIGAIVGVFLLYLTMVLVGLAVGVLWVSPHLGVTW